MQLTRRAGVLLLAALAGAALTTRLGVWQLDRAAQKIAIQSALDSRRALPPLLGTELARTEQQVHEQEYRAVVVAGHWLPERTVYLDNRPMNGHAGFFAVTPLLLDDGSAVLVQRGWLPRDQADRTRIEAPPTPAGPVQVAGHIATSLSRASQIGGAGSGPIRQNLDLDAFAAETGLVLRPLAIVQENGALTPADGLLRDWPAPAADVQMHYGYAVQWFAMAALIIGLYVWFQLIRPRRLGR